MRLAFTLLGCFLLFGLQAQHTLTGVLLDSVTAQPVQFAHVSNYRSGFMTTTNATGHFRLPAQAGDTVVFSIVGYQTLGWSVRASWLDSLKVFYLPQDTLLLDQVIVQDIPPEAIFKQKILDHQPQDSSFWYHGMPPPRYREGPVVTERLLKNPLFAVLQPTDFLYHKFSKREKEKRNYYQVAKNHERTQRAYRKFSREWVGEMTLLEEDELTDFIQYCNYSLEYLERTPKYLILENMLAKLKAFKKERKG